MAETLLAETEKQNKTDLHQRKIDFVPVKKPFKGFSNDFHIETLNPTTTEPRQHGSGTSLAVSKKHDVTEFSEYGLDPDLSFGMTVRRIGAGLLNLGNTCYLNSVLQCLTYTEPLAAYLQSGKHKSSCHVAGFCALCAVQNHVSRALQSTGRILAPEAMVGNLRCISRNFRYMRQEDAHEYMVNLLESMHKCCLPSGVPSESPGAYEKSLVHKIFGGRLRSQVKCQQCSYGSNKFDPFLDLSLEIFKADSLQKALTNFTAAELLDGGEKQYHCQRCKQKVRAVKQLTIHKAPYVLTIHLKRFHAHDPSQKIKKKVHFGCTLDLKPFVSGSYDGDVKYSLYGVLVHSGSNTRNGHYFCYVRTANNMWYTLNDNQVSHVSEREVLNQQAYMLFYVRDRKSIVPKKPVNIAKEENMKANVNGSRGSSTSKNVLKEYQNGHSENKFCGEPSTAGIPKIVSNTDPSRVSSTKDDSDQQKRNSVILAESLMQSKKLVSELPSKAHTQEDSSVGGLSSLEHPGKDDNMKSLASPDVDTAIVLYKKEISKDSVAKVDTSAEDSNADLSKSTIPITPLIQPNLIYKVGTSATSLVDEKTCTGMGENMIDSHGLVLTGSLNRSLVTECLNQKQVKKSQKKFLKYPAPGLQLRSNPLFLGYIGPRKKKNCKRSKHRKLDLKNPNKEKLKKHNISLDIGPSTPGKAHVFSSVTSFSEIKASEASYRPGANIKSNDESLMEDNAEGEFSKRFDQNSAVLATANQVENIPQCSVVNEFESRGLEESVVAPWDDIELPSSQSLELKNKIVSIGYVGDEWDEEYDTGKRKKIRGLKQSFDGPNLFQQIATEKSKSKRQRLDQSNSTVKSKFKRARLDQTNSGNPPFRI